MFGHKYLAALGHLENISCQMIAKKLPNGDTSFFQKVNFHVKTTFDALILCLEFRRMFEIKKLKRVLENVEAISSYSHEYVQMG